jgi:cell division protein FtsZ
VRGITDLMVMPGLINLDFADVRSVMSEMGKAMMGTGEASGDNRAIEAAEKAIANPLLDGVSMKGAKGVIVSIVGGEDMRLMEVDEAANHIKELVDPDANIIWGSAFNNDLEGRIRVSVVATGIEAEASTQAEPAKLFAFPPRTPVGRVEEKPAAAPAPAPAPVEAAAPQPVVAEQVPAEDAERIQLTPPEPVAAEAPKPTVYGEDELLLDADTILTPPVGGNPLPLEETAGNRPWVAEPEPRATRPSREGGTLFERMSSIARGAAKAEVKDEEPARRDALDIPRFLNRQNNQ